jgi:phosphatidylinositol glycan class N
MRPRLARVQSFFAGLAYPMNSVGVLPTAYIDAPQSSVSDGLLQNALEIYEQFLRKAQMKRDHSIMFKNFKPLHDADTTVLSHPLQRVSCVPCVSCFVLS